jgi:hypothetical protein
VKTRFLKLLRSNIFQLAPLRRGDASPLWEQLEQLTQQLQQQHEQELEQEQEQQQLRQQVHALRRSVSLASFPPLYGNGGGGGGPGGFTPKFSATLSLHLPGVSSREGNSPSFSSLMSPPRNPAHAAAAAGGFRSAWDQEGEGSGRVHAQLQPFRSATLPAGLGALSRPAELTSSQLAYLSTSRETATSNDLDNLEPQASPRPQPQPQQTQMTKRSCSFSNRMYDSTFGMFQKMMLSKKKDDRKP